MAIDLLKRLIIWNGGSRYFEHALPCLIVHLYSDDACTCESKHAGLVLLAGRVSGDGTHGSGEGTYRPKLDKYSMSH